MPVRAFGHPGIRTARERSAGLPSGTHYARTSNSLGYLDELYDDIACPSGCTVTTGTAISVSVGATTAGIDFGLNPGGRISGTVTNAATGAPLAGVSVDVINSAGSYVGYGYTSSSGVYTTYSGLPTGTYYALTWNSQGYIDELYNNIPCPSGSCSPTSGTPIAVTSGTTTTGINFGLAPCGRVCGTVSWYQVEKRYVRKNGEVFWTRLTISAVRDSQGNPLYLVELIDDINEQRKALEHLRESEERFRAMFDTAVVGITLLAPDRRVLAVNPVVLKMSGYTEAEMLLLPGQEIT